MFKKICSLVMCIALVFTMFMTVNVGAEEAATVSTRQDDAIALMTDIGIYKAEDSITSATEVSRGFAAAVVTRLLGIDGLGSSATGFSDVPDTHAYAKAIATVKDLGIMKGFGDGTFLPDATLTYAQLVKVMIVALGYEPQAEYLGGYPTGYLSKAIHLGILDGTNKEDTAITAGTFAVILENTLNTEILAGSKIKVGNYEKYAEGSTLGSVYLGIERLKGQVTGTYFSSFRSNRALLKGEVAIDGVPVNVGTTKIESYFGMNVIAYIKTESYTDEFVAVSVRPDSRTKTYDFKSDSVSSSGISATSVTYYDEDEKACQVSVASDAKLILNGSFVDRQPTVADYTVENGVIKLIAPTGSEATVVFIETYINGIVDTVDNEDSRVFFKNPVDGTSLALTIDVNNRSVKTVVQNFDGTPASIGEFAENDVVSIIKGASTLKAIRSNEKIRGVVKELGSGTVMIDETKYDVAPELLDTTNDLEKLEIGIEAIFYKDYAGKIAVIAKKAADGKNAYRYGYLVAGVTEPGIKKKTQIKVFTEDGEWKVFEFKDFIEFNGVKHTDSTTVLDASSPLMTGGINAEPELNHKGVLEDYDKDYKALKAVQAPDQVYEQLIRYKLDDTGIITELETARRGFELNTQEREKYFTRDNEMNINNSTVTNGVPGKMAARVLGNPSYMFGTEFYLRSNTKIFEIPEIYSEGNENAYKVKAYTTMDHSITEKPHSWIYDLRLYDVDETTRIVGAMIDRKPGLKAEENKVGDYSDIGIVTGVSKGFDSKGGDVYIISVYKSSGAIGKFVCEEDFNIGFNYKNRYGVLTEASEEEADVKDPSTGKLLDYISVDKLNKGDVLQYIAGADGADMKISAAAVLLRADSPLVGERGYENSDSLAATSRYHAYNANNYFYGKVKTVCPETLVMQSYPACGYTKYTDENQGLVTDTLLDRAFHFTGATCVMYDREKDTIRPITYASIRAGEDYVFVDKQKLNMKWIIVYR